MVKDLPVIHQQDKVARKASDISSWLAILITREKVSSFFASVVKAFLHNTAVCMINIFFHVCLISLISCWHVTHLSHHSVRFERQSLHDSQFKVLCRDFLRWWRLEHWKIRIAHRQWTLQESEENQYTKRKTQSYIFSGFGYGISRG